MREIKFRSWDAVNKKFWYWSAGDIDSHSFWNGVRVHGHIPSEYTGRKDANRVEIYEDDIVVIEGIYNHPIVYKDTCFMMREYPLHQAITGWNIEVIGNKFQNTELSEEEHND